MKEKEKWERSLKVSNESRREVTRWNTEWFNVRSAAWNFTITVKVFAVVTTTPTLNVITLRRTSWILRPRCSHFVNNRANRARYCESLLWFTTMGSFIVASIGLSTMLTWHISDDIQWCNKKINCCQKTFFLWINI